MPKQPMKKQPVKKKVIQEKEVEIALPGAVGEKRQDNPGNWDKLTKKPRTVLLMTEEQAKALADHLAKTIPKDEPVGSPLRKVMDVMRG